MPIVILEKTQKVLQIDMPHKCGSSTVNGFLGYTFWKDYSQGTKRDILRDQQKWFIKNKNYSRNIDYKIAIIRDPISRMKSIYSDRILQKNRNNMQDFIKDWDDFVLNFKEYQNKFHDLYIHSQLQTSYLEKNINNYDKIFTTSQINNEVRYFISKISEIEIPYLNKKSSKKFQNDMVVTEDQKTLIKNYFLEDYDKLGHFFFNKI